MDELDKKIIEYLVNDSRTPFLSIAKQIGVSEGTIRQRVAKLQNRGVIKKFTAELGYVTTAIIEVVTSSSVPTQKVSDKIKKLGVRRVYEVTGRFSIIAVIQTSEFKQLNQILEGIRAIEGVVQTETFSVLKEC
jgi:Lrp/AsnC family transcriptional regulator of lysine biosynthesis